MKKQIVLILCLLLFLLLAACQAETKPATIEPPIDGLTWGMTVDEVKDALVKGGLERDKIVFHQPNGEGHAQLHLSAEQCKTLKIDPLPGCPRSEGVVPVILFFLDDKEGDCHLAYAYTDVTAENKADAAAQLTKLYGEPTGENFWEVDGKQVNLRNGAFDTEFIVVYHANKYVKENFGNF